MDEGRISIEGLSEATGVKVRTLRQWTHEGLLERPGVGRYASYSADTVETVSRIREMKLDGAFLPEIRKALASEGRPPSAQSYLDGLRTSGAFRGAETGHERVHGEGNSLGGSAAGAFRTSSPGITTLVRVEVAPNVHLVADGPLTPAETETLCLAAQAALSVITARKPRGSS